MFYHLLWAQHGTWGGPGPGLHPQPNQAFSRALRLLWGGVAGAHRSQGILEKSCGYGGLETPAKIPPPACFLKEKKKKKDKKKIRKKNNKNPACEKECIFMKIAPSNRTSCFKMPDAHSCLHDSWEEARRAIPPFVSFRSYSREIAKPETRQRGFKGRNERSMPSVSKL